MYIYIHTYAYIYIIYIYILIVDHSLFPPEAPVSIMMKRLQQHVEARRWLRTNMTSCALSVLHLATVDPELVVESRKRVLYIHSMNYIVRTWLRFVTARYGTVGR